jgi:vacuolar iron transporter family protein
MGVGGYLSTKAERDNYRYLLRQTRQRVETSCSTALQQEVFNILAPYGISSIDCQRLVQSLENAEKAGSDSGDHDKGLTQFLLKFGTGVETISSWRLYASALTIGISYFIGGLIPMVCLPPLSRTDFRYLISLCCQRQKLCLSPSGSQRLFC